MKKPSDAFSLVEMLLFLGLLVLLVSISIPVFTTIGKGADGADLGFAASQISGRIQLARQLAMATKGEVEVRIYETKDSVGSRSYRTVAVYKVGEDQNADGMPDAFILQDKMTYLPPGTVFVQGSLSSLISEAPYQGQDNMPGHNQVNYAAFRFKSSGSTDLPAKASSGADWKLTIVLHKDAAASNLPVDYAILTLNPQVGTVQVARP
jgi:uncharacterized protein (TIGR02596 family)